MLARQFVGFVRVEEQWNEVVLVGEQIALVLELAFELHVCDQLQHKLNITPLLSSSFELYQIDLIFTSRHSFSFIRLRLAMYSF